MAPDVKHRLPPLAAVSDAARSASDDARSGPRSLREHEVDWSIYMARAQSGDKAAYRRLLEDIVPYLRSLAVAHFRNHSDVEDLVQEVLLTVHAVRHTYDPARSFGPWLAALAQRRIIDKLRRQGRARAHETQLEDGYETFTAPEANLLERESDARELRAAIDRLPTGQREAIQLVKLREMSLKEASAASGMSIAALKVAIHRAVKNLRKLLGAQDGKT